MGVGYAYGYWTNYALNGNLAWIISYCGNIYAFDKTISNERGVRPVIVVSKTSLAG